MKFSVLIMAGFVLIKTEIENCKSKIRLEITACLVPYDSFKRTEYD